MNIGMAQVLGNVLSRRASYRAGIRRMAGAVQSASPGLFLRELLDRPGAIGAVCPSSTRLAQRMAGAVPSGGQGLVVELGGGTGAVTRALLDAGIPPDRLRVVERSASFAQHLRQRFPSVSILQGDAAELATLLPDGAGIDAVVSSLPLRSLPRPVVQAILAQWRQVLQPGGLVIQFTYALHGRPEALFDGFGLLDEQIVWANLPPARMLVLARQACVA
jgi:phospholipid N-methyltransferase